MKEAEMFEMDKALKLAAGDQRAGKPSSAEPTCEMCKAGWPTATFHRDPKGIIFADPCGAVPAPPPVSALRDAIDRVISAGDDLRYDEYGVMEMPIGHLATKWDNAKKALAAALKDAQ